VNGVSTDSGGGGCSLSPGSNPASALVSAAAAGWLLLGCSVRLRGRRRKSPGSLGVRG
jgi:hypothetical protein